MVFTQSANAFRTALRWVIAATVFGSFIGRAPQTARAAPMTPTFTVNSAFDLPASAPLDNGVCETAPGNGLCTLRAAIMKANHQPGGATIRFGLPGVVTYTLTIAPSLLDDERTGDLNITNPVNLVGNGATHTIIDGNGTDRVFNVGHAISATIAGVTIENGTQLHCGGGGGIFNDGNLTLSDSTVSGNTVGCLEASVSYGAGVVNWSQAVLTVTDSIINGNTDDASLGEGGGIYTAGPLMLVNSTVSGNTNYYGGSGGGLFAVYGPVTVISSTINANRSPDGGGLYFVAAPGTISSSTISGNSAENGGGVFHESLHPLAIDNTTVANNNSFSNGGGIYNSSGPTSLFNVTLSGNLANAEGHRGGVGGGVLNTISGTVNIQNSILAGNSYVTLIVGHVYLNPEDCNGTLTSLGNNILRTEADCSVSGSGVTVADPLLGPLADNGGPTQTQALLPGSPAIDAGNVDGCTDSFGALLASDQRGHQRPANGGGSLRCDIGAFELQRLLYLPLLIR
jgi:hypothetical protein